MWSGVERKIFGTGRKGFLGMKRVFLVLTLFVGFLVALGSLYGYFLLQQRAGLPLEIKKAFQRGQLIQIEDAKIERKEDLEFILSRKRPGQSISVLLNVNDKIARIQEKLIPFYAQTPYPLINLVIGFFLLVIAFVVFILRPHDLRARLFYWGALFFSFSLIVNGGFYCLGDKWFSYVPGILFYIFYPLSAAFLLHFSLTFIRTRLKRPIVFVYLPAVLFSLLWNYFFLASSMRSSIEIYRQYQVVVFHFRILVVIYLLLSFLALFLGYRKARFEEEKAQIKWVLFGLFLGMGPFIFLYQLPRVLLKKPFLSEELVGVFYIFIPIAFSFSIVRFKLMNIELVINRSLVYSILTMFTVSVYLISIQVVNRIFISSIAIQSTTVSLIGVLAAAAAFHPARRKIQDFVDKSFFRISYDYRKSIRSFSELAHNMTQQDQLLDLFLVGIQNTIPLEYLGIRVMSTTSEGIEVLLEMGGKKGLEDLTSKALSANQVLARRKGVSTEMGVDFSVEDLITEKNLEMIIPLHFRTPFLSGFLALGKKRSRTKYSRDDIELFLTMAEALTLNLERIYLQKEVILERAEKEKLDELNRLKTEFISNVSHEIRTPLSSIHSLSEILQQGKIKEKSKQEELLSLMASECGRLSRLLHNILDHAKIDQKAMSYRLSKVNMCSLVGEIIELNEKRIKSLGFSVTWSIPRKVLWLDVDPDAIKQALTNLLDNAIKYSLDRREIDIKLWEKDQGAEIYIQDKGIGIGDSEKEKIFDGFYRSGEAQVVNPKGAGIGLKIVKHIMEAHGGQVLVRSQKNKGSTFILIFPKP